VMFKEDTLRIPRCSVLVVDDHISIRELIGLFLSRQGHQCITAKNGIEALNKICQNKCEAVVADLAMPEMDGITLTKNLLGLYPKLRIMAMTGYLKEYSIESVIKAGVRDLIWKPFRIDEFILRFNKMMGYHETFCQVDHEKCSSICREFPKSMLCR
jgi:CheY-like chemotaxis protein